MANNILSKAHQSLPKHLIFLLLCVPLICSVTSCTKTDIASDKTRPQNKNILRYDVTAPFTPLDLTTVSASGSINVFPLLYCYLSAYNPYGGQLQQPDLATKWTYDPKSFTWTIHLRKDALFHNKQPVTAKDVKYSLEITSMNAYINSISLLSDTALSIHLKKNDPGFFERIWAPIIPHPDRRTGDDDNRPIGSGPFKFGYMKGEKEVFLVANEDYYEGRPSLDGVLFYYEDNKEKAWTRLLSGATDIAQEISPKNYEIIKQYENRFYFDRYTLGYYSILLYNTTDPLFSDLNVRLALSHAINKEYIVEKILDGCGVVAAGPLGVDSAYHNPEVKPIPYSPEKALELLRQAGWSYDKNGCRLIKEGKRFEFTISVFEEYQIEKRIAQYIKLCLNDIGIKVRLESVPFEKLVRRYLGNNEFQAVLTELNSQKRRPLRLQDIWSSHFSKTPSNCFEHPEVTRLIREAIDAKDPERQRKLFHKLDALIASLQPGTFLFHKTAIDLMSKRFSLPYPFSLTSDGIDRLKYASLNKT